MPIHVSNGNGEADAHDRQDVGKVKHVPVDTGRIGRAGERWARAAILGILMELTPERRGIAVKDIEDVLRNRFKGEAIPPLLQAASDFRDAPDEDHELEALARLVHVSAVSDAFGFDLIGYLPAASDSVKWTHPGAE